MYKLIYLQDAINLLTERHCDICPYNDHRHNGQRCNECDFQERCDLYGDERIDKPGWLKWKADLMKENERRTDG